MRRGSVSGQHRPLAVGPGGAAGPGRAGAPAFKTRQERGWFDCPRGPISGQYRPLAVGPAPAHNRPCHARSLRPRIAGSTERASVGQVRARHEARRTFTRSATNAYTQPRTCPSLARGADPGRAGAQASKPGSKEGGFDSHAGLTRRLFRLHPRASRRTVVDIDPDIGRLCRPRPCRIVLDRGNAHERRTPSHTRLVIAGF